MVNNSNYMQVVMLGETPRLILVAKQEIEVGTELLYDYGDRYRRGNRCLPVSIRLISSVGIGVFLLPSTFRTFSAFFYIQTDIYTAMILVNSKINIYEL